MASRWHAPSPSGRKSRMPATCSSARPRRCSGRLVKALAAWRAGLVAIVCVGETRAEREAGIAIAVVSNQLAGSVPDGAAADRLVIAYEPVWAIGTGLTPTIADITEMHAAIRSRIPAGTRILYGGSVNPKNAAEILALREVDGALVGGASLKAEDFWAIAEACA